MKEILVAVACLYNKGCTDASQVYYSQAPELQEVARNIERKGKDALGPIVSEYGVPIIGAALKLDVNVRLTDTVNLQLTKKGVLCILNFQF